MPMYLLYSCVTVKVFKEILRIMLVSQNIYQTHMYSKVDMIKLGLFHFNTVVGSAKMPKENMVQEP